MRNQIITHENMSNENNRRWYKWNYSNRFGDNAKQYACSGYLKEWIIITHKQPASEEVAIQKHVNTTV